MKLVSGLIWALLFFYIASLFINPFLALLLFKIRRRNLPDVSSLKREVPLTSQAGTSAPLLEVLIPAHNEEKDIKRTIQSILNSLEKAELESRIVVGADHCSDQTETVAKEIGAEVISFPFASKWLTLKALVEQGQSEWVAFVDVGMEWDENLIPEFIKNYASTDLFFIAPSYRMERSHFLSRLNWKIERFLKKIENKSGGPVSVHGASVFYRRSYLVSVLDFLKEQVWLNDDVIIPLTMRALYPSQFGIYLPEAQVMDFSVKPATTDRRFRILMGNLEILNFINANKMNLTPELHLLWGRRRARVFWAYFVIASLLQFCSLMPMALLLKFLMGISGLALLFSRKAFRVSVVAPFYLLKMYWARWTSTSTPKIKWH